MEYEERRSTIYKPLRDEGTFTWDFMYGAEYALADIHLYAGNDSISLLKQWIHNVLKTTEINKDMNEI